MRTPPINTGWNDGSTEQTGKQGYEGQTDESDAAPGHELFHTLGLRTGVIITVTFEQVDGTPDAQTGTERDNESLKNIDSTVEEIHERVAGIVVRKE